MKHGTYNVERTDCPALTGSDRLMLGMSCDKATALTYLERYRTRYPHMTFELADNAPAETCYIPPLFHIEGNRYH